MPWATGRSDKQIEPAIALLSRCVIYDSCEKFSCYLNLSSILIPLNSWLSVVLDPLAFVLENISFLCCLLGLARLDSTLSTSVARLLCVGCILS